MSLSPVLHALTDRDSIGVNTILAAVLWATCTTKQSKGIASTSRQGAGALAVRADSLADRACKMRLLDNALLDFLPIACYSKHDAPPATEVSLHLLC